MKKYLLFFVLFCCSFCFAQKSAADLQQEASQEIAAGNYSFAIGLLKESAAAARESKDNRALGKSLTALGDAYSKIGSNAEALKNYQLALPELKKIHDNLGVANVSKELGRLYGHLNKYELALKYYTEAAAIGKQLNNEILTADCLSGAGPMYEEMHQIEKALEVYSQALAIYRARGMEILAGETLSSMGNAYKKHGDYPQAILNYKEALGYFNSANDHKKVADVLSSLGSVQVLMEDHNESLRLYEQAYLDAVAIQYDKVIVEASLGMANAYENLRQYPESVRYHKIYEQKSEIYNKKLQTEEFAKYKERMGKGKTVTVTTTGSDTASSTPFMKDKYALFGIGAVGVLLLMLVAGFFWRRSLLKKNQEDTMFSEAEGQERLRMVQNIHQDLDTKLEEINSLSESIMERANGMPTIKIQGEAMQETTKKIEENIRDLVWLLTPKTTTLTNYSGSIKEYVLDYFSDSPIEVLVSEPEGMSSTIITKESQLGLLSVIKETLVFIKEDPQASKVFFGITYSGTRLMVSIKDNGRGNDITDADKKRLDGHLSPTGGIMRMDCDPGWGTTVKIIIPVDKSTKRKPAGALNFF
ncbi:tetratricopeptide repeat protein [Flavobacterium sp. DG1-102-2]|uniref:tetratricopeptide repeat protein n=1 Tax=Flavobacterium sp. DG1-102-2 TaxID=3081663 RepID=UPI002949CC69|nr:tetratricopeptide repeat protein [Flavobacterium sp. DG1-102-2]MDV6170068.1 tetratricopeptide repeat protein [Flavobacterium sp. DG1-102-2]